MKQSNERTALLALVAGVTLSLGMCTPSAEAELILELGLGHTYPSDTLGDNKINSQPIGTVELGYVHPSGFGLSYLHISNPAEEDYGINMVRVTKRFTLFGE